MWNGLWQTNLVYAHDVPNEKHRMMEVEFSRPLSDELTAEFHSLVSIWLELSPAELLLRYGRDGSEVSHPQFEKFEWKQVKELPPEVIRACHARFRGTSAEELVWNEIVTACRAPLPSDIAHDLIDRNIAITALGHSRQEDEIHYRLGKTYSESALTIALECYRRDSRSLAEFTRCLNEFRGSLWLYESLWLTQPSCEEKRIVLLRGLDSQPEIKARILGKEQERRARREHRR